jgi:hypothetical protein
VFFLYAWVVRRLGDRRSSGRRALLYRNELERIYDIRKAVVRRVGLKVEEKSVCVCVCVG